MPKKSCNSVRCKLLITEFVTHPTEVHTDGIGPDHLDRQQPLDLKNVADLVIPEIDHQNKQEVVAGNPLVGLSEAAAVLAVVVSRKILCLTRQPRLE